jgi:hypothetical protein
LARSPEQAKNRLRAGILSDDWLDADSVSVPLDL